MSGRELLGELLRLAEEQTEALTAGDMTLFGHLCNQRGAYILALSSADWTDTAGVPQAARELVASGERLERLLREQLVIVGGELGDVRRMTVTLRGYGQLSQASRGAAAVLDRSA